MQATWRTTFELLRRHPALWWPVLLADLLAFGLQNLRRAIGLQVLQWTTPQEQSVLGGPAIPVEPSYGKVVAVGGSVNVLIYYLCILVFCMALAAVAVKTCSLLAEEAVADETSVQDKKPHGIVGFSLIMAVFILCTDALALLLPSFVLSHLNRLDLLQRVWFTPSTLVPIYLLQAYVLSPFALAFLNEVRLAEVGSSQRRKGRLASLAVALVFIALLFVFSVVQIPTPPTYAMSLMRDTIISLLTTFPYVVLFVALSVIALERDSGTEALPVDESVPAE